MSTMEKLHAEAARIADLPKDEIAPAIVSLVDAFASDAIAFTLQVLLGGGSRGDTPDAREAA